MRNNWLLSLLNLILAMSLVILWCHLKHLPWRHLLLLSRVDQALRVRETFTFLRLKGGVAMLHSDLLLDLRVQLLLSLNGLWGSATFVGSSGASSLLKLDSFLLDPFWSNFWRDLGHLFHGLGV